MIIRLRSLLALLICVLIAGGVALAERHEGHRERERRDWRQAREHREQWERRERERHQWAERQRHERERREWAERQRRERWEREHRVHDRRPPGWDHGRKTGWDGHGVPPRQARHTSGWVRPHPSVPTATTGQNPATQPAPRPAPKMIQALRAKGQH